MKKSNFVDSDRISFLDLEKSFEVLNAEESKNIQTTIYGLKKTRLSHCNLLESHEIDLVDRDLLEIEQKRKVKSCITFREL